MPRKVIIITNLQHSILKLCDSNDPVSGFLISTLISQLIMLKSNKTRTNTFNNPPLCKLSWFLRLHTHNLTS